MAAPLVPTTDTLHPHCQKSLAPSPARLQHSLNTSNLHPTARFCPPLFCAYAAGGQGQPQMVSPTFRLRNDLHLRSLVAKTTQPLRCGRCGGPLGAIFLFLDRRPAGARPDSRPKKPANPAHPKPHEPAKPAAPSGSQRPGRHPESTHPGQPGQRGAPRAPNLSQQRWPTPATNPNRPRRGAPQAQRSSRRPAASNTPPAGNGAEPQSPPAAAPSQPGVPLGSQPQQPPAPGRSNRSRRRTRQRQPEPTNRQPPTGKAKKNKPDHARRDTTHPSHSRPGDALV